MSKYIIRLDDASDYMDLDKWNKIEILLDTYDIKPIFGIIPDNRDSSLVSQYKKNPQFWTLMKNWIDKGWIPAMHGFEHKYVTQDGGINPVNHKSEFAGLSYEEQAEKIRKGYKILLEHAIKPEIFFAPAHTFDENTLRAIKKETSIRVINDTPAWDVYFRGGFTFIPQQSGRVRKLPFKTVTFCYHPNTMLENDYTKLEKFILNHKNEFGFNINLIRMNNRRFSISDYIVYRMYFGLHTFKDVVKSFFTKSLFSIFPKINGKSLSWSVKLSSY